jgi:phosphodiesterase/alkaline phosphatase D-like protein
VAATLSGLAPGTTYHFRVVATSDAGTSRGSDQTFSTSAPSAVVTGSPSSLGPISATVSGTVNPNGQSTSWYFEYGTSTSYGAKTSLRGAGSGTSPLSVSLQLTGLKVATIYHYRLVASNNSGTSRGSDQTFSTVVLPVVVTGPASVGPSSATVSGTVNPNGQSTSWYFEYGTSTSYGTKTSLRGAGSGTSPVSVSLQLTGLKAATSYHYRLVASNNSGTSRGSDQTFSTALLPAVATGPATSIGPTWATVSGTVNPNGQSTSWYFEYGTSTGYGVRTSLRGAGSGMSPLSVSLQLTGLKAATTYHYRLVASSSSGTSRGSDQTFSTSLPPVARTGPAQGVAPLSASLTGSVIANGRPTSWQFQYGTTAAYGSKTPLVSAGSGFSDKNVAAMINGLAPGTTYHYRLVALSDAGTSLGSDLTFTSATVTLATGGPIVVYGRAVTLSGAVSTRQAGERVTVLAQRHGEATFQPVATVTTGAGGVWSVRVRPTIRTVYQATWKGANTRPAVIGVRPFVTLRLLAGNRLSTRVSAARSFAGRLVQLQRQSSTGHWTTIQRLRLGPNSAATFPLPRRNHAASFRVAISVNQAGPGYLAGYSRTITHPR